MGPTTNDFGLSELLKHKPIACSAFLHVEIYLHIILQRCINCVWKDMGYVQIFLWCYL